ncbi:MAG: hypothetical protein GY874_13895 [Desulfobacteraceae bacterium]|nr:hypothetical protein [Desulfobacteraceae bacterium]
MQIFRKLKQESTFRIWKDHHELQKHFWKERTFWSDEYFYCSIRKASIDTVSKYIEIAQKRFIKIWVQNQSGVNFQTADILKYF